MCRDTELRRRDIWLTLRPPIQLTARALPRLDEDDRLLPVLAHLSLGFIAGVTSDYSDSAVKLDDGSNITAAHVDALIRKHAPMCMRNLHENLRRDKHLKHYGRLQYNLFLKVSSFVSAL